MYKITQTLIGVNARYFNYNLQSFRRLHIQRKFFDRKFNESNLPLLYTLNRRKLQTLTFQNDEDLDQTFTALSIAYNEHSRINALNILNAIENLNFKLLNDKQGLLLLQCCGHAISDKTFQARSELCDKVWNSLKEHGTVFDIQHYNTYLQVCIENKVQIDFKKFILEMECEPNKETFNLLLECVCEVGDTQQAIEIVAIMKSKKYPADERMFDALILGHSIKGGLKEAETVLEAIQAAHIPVTSATKFALIRGLSGRGDLKEFVKALQMYPDITEQEVLTLLLSIGLNGNHHWLKLILQIIGPIKLSKQAMQQLSLLCIHLIHSGKPETAYIFYKEFINSPTDDGNYAFFLLVEMLHTLTPSKILIDIANDLQQSGMNSFALEKITGIALRRKFYETAWDLLETFPMLRPHYFWPLLLQAEKQDREMGVLNVMEKMINWDVKIDLDTLEFYCLPFCDTSYPEMLVARLQNFNFTIKELLSPLLAVLLRENRFATVQEVYRIYDDVVLNSDRLLAPLVKAWHNTGDAENVVTILHKFSKFASAPVDYAGYFLLRCLRLCETPVHHEQFLELLKVMENRNLHISLSTSDSLHHRMKLPSHRVELTARILNSIEKLTNMSVSNMTPHIPHPRDMSISELECHLIELQNKNMEKRGVLRRLIQAHARLGNERRVNELRQMFSSTGYAETSGMKASLLASYIANEKVESALNMYHEIKTNDATFDIDSFKILDLATLLVKNQQFDRAVYILQNETKDRPARGGSAIIRNCWRLLGAADNEIHAEKLFHLLVDRNYCVPTNVILGPLIKIHLKQGNVVKAVKAFTEFGIKYKCTPLKVEVLHATVKAEDEILMQNVLSIVSKIHGANSAALSLVTVLAQTGLQKSLRKYLLEIKNIDETKMETQCRRWIRDNNIFALQTLATATDSLPDYIIARSMIHKSIMQIHSINNDCESAVKFYQQLLEKEEFIPKDLVDLLLDLISRCKYKMPEVLKSTQQ